MMLVSARICQLPPSLCAMALPCEHGPLRPAAGEGLAPFGEEQGIWQTCSNIFGLHSVFSMGAHKH